MSINLISAIDVTIYCDESYLPYSYEKNGEAKGIYTDILKKAFTKMDGFEVKIMPIGWKRGLTMLKFGQAFALYPPYHRPVERYYIDYSVPILDEELILLCRKGLDIKKLQKWPDDYKGLVIGANLGFSLIKKEVNKGIVKLEESEDNYMNLKKLIMGRIDCYANDKNAMFWTLKQMKLNGEYNEKKDGKLNIGATIRKEPGYLGFTNKDNGKFFYKKNFIKQFNKIIEEMKKNGEIKKIVLNYIN